MKLFESGLLQQLEAKPKLSMRDKRIVAVLKSPPSQRRTRKIERWENAARAAGGVDPTTGAIDWQNFDWAKFLEVILQIIAKFFLA